MCQNGTFCKKFVRLSAHGYTQVSTQHERCVRNRSILGKFIHLFTQDSLFNSIELLSMRVLSSLRNTTEGLQRDWNWNPSILCPNRSATDAICVLNALNLQIYYNLKENVPFYSKHSVQSATNDCDLSRLKFRTVLQKAPINLGYLEETFALESERNWSRFCNN